MLFLDALAYNNYCIREHYFQTVSANYSKLLKPNVSLIIVGAITLILYLTHI